MSKPKPCAVASGSVAAPLPVLVTSWANGAWVAPVTVPPAIAGADTSEARETARAAAKVLRLKVDMSNELLVSFRGYGFGPVAPLLSRYQKDIGRASGRERVCQDV